MGHSTIGFNTKTLAIIAALLVGALVAVYAFNVSWNTIGTIAFVGFFVWMHLGGHGMHGGHGGMHGENGDATRRDAHAGHTVDAARDNNARTIAPDSNARGLPSDAQAKSVARAEPRDRGGC